MFKTSEAKIFGHHSSLITNRTFVFNTSEHFNQTRMGITGCSKHSNLFSGSFEANIFWHYRYLNLSFLGITSRFQMQPTFQSFESNIRVQITIVKHFEDFRESRSSSKHFKIYLFLAITNQFRTFEKKGQARSNISK